MDHLKQSSRISRLIRAWRRLLLIGFLLAGFGIYLLTRSPPKDLIPWRTDFPSARQEAIAQHRLLFLEFSASWCEPCQMMQATTWSNPAVARAMEAYVPVSIDVEGQPRIAASYRIGTIPSFVVVDPVGQKTLKSASGWMLPKQLLQWLDQKDEEKR